MAAAKSGNHIYISGAGNTLASITTDIADATFIEKTSTAPDIYTVKGNVSRYFRIRNGGTLTIGNAADYSTNETLAFENLAVDRTRFYVDTGGTLLQYGDTKIDFSISANRPYYSYLYGKIDCLGNATYKPVWQNYRRLYMHESQNNDTYSNDVWHFEKMIIGSAFTANDYAFYLFASAGKVRNHIFKDILFDKTYGRGNNMYAIRIPYSLNGIGNITFEDLDFNNVGNYPLYVSGANIKVLNTTFGTTASWKCYLYGRGCPDPANTVRDFDYHNEHFFGQQFMFLDGCTFENLANQACCLVRYQANVLFKNCEWQHTASDSMQVDYQGRVMMWSGNTFTGGREYYDLDFDGIVQWVYGLTLTINDETGNPLENATVLIEQNGSKEKFVFRTKANGKLSNCHDIECALLTWKHQYGNSKTVNMEYWSDSSNNTKHTITVFKDGYRPHTEDYVMDQDRSDTIQLKKIDAHSLTF